MLPTEQMFLPEIMRFWADSTPQSVALSSGDTELTYEALAALVDDGAARLHESGVGQGERVVIAGANTLGWVVTFLAVLQCGAIVVPLNSRLGAQQVPDLLRDIDPSVVIVDDSQQDAFAQVVASSPSKIILIGAGNADVLTALPATSARFEMPELAGGSPALLSFTSGTTSAPKGALISHGGMMAGARSWLPHSKAQKGTLTTILVPLFHNTGYVDQLAHMLVAGGQVDLIPRYRTETAVDAMIRRPPNFFVSVPSILRMLMLHDAADRILGACTTAAVGGSPMPQAWARELHERWPSVNLMQGYGLTEFTSLSHLIGGVEALEHGESVGRAVEGVRCEIRDEDGRLLQPEVPGEVWLTGPQMMLGYWRNPEATARAIVDGWLRTGDRGVLDPVGRLSILGRIDGVINRGGEKISPLAVEEVLARVPSVADATVFGLPDEVLGERVVAAIVPRSGKVFEPDGARATIGDRLPGYAWPSQFLILSRMPLAETGKVDQRRLVALAMEQARSLSCP